MSNTSGLYGDDDSPQPASTGLYTDGDVTTTTSNNTTGLYPENTFTPSTGGDVVVDGSLVVRENLSVGGDTALNGTLGVGGAATFSGLITGQAGLDINGAATLEALTATGPVELTNLTVNGATCIDEVHIENTTVSTCSGSTTDLTLNSLTGQIAVAATNVSIAQGTTIKYNENNTTSNSPTFQSTSGDASSVRVRAPSATTSANANITALNSNSTTDNKFVSVQARGSATTPLRINIGQTVGGVSGATTSKLAFTNFGTAFAYANPAGTVDNLDYATKSYVDSIPDVNTTYTIDVTATTGGGNFNLRGSDSSVDTIKFANGTGITVAETGSSTLTVTNTGVITVNGQSGTAVLDTDDISEGATNLYFTTARARNSISASGDISYNPTTGVISYTTPAPSNPFDQDLNTTDAVQFASVNINGQYTFPTVDGTNAQLLATTGTGATYWTDASAFSQDYSNVVDPTTGGANLILREAISPMGYIIHSTTTFAEGTGIDISTTGPGNLTVTNTGVITVNGQSGTASLDTDDIPEGTTNEYFTVARARNSISASGDISYNPSTGVISYTTPAPGNPFDQDLNTTDAVRFASVIADSLAVDTAATVAVGTGEFAWNPIDATVDLGLENGVVLQLGQEQHVYGKATQAISNGQVVMFGGAQGSHILFSLADTSVMGFTEEYIIGVATQDFAINQFGYVTTMGTVRELDTSAWAEGDLLWLDNSTPGALTTTQPAKPGYQILVAAVTRDNASQGTIYVRPTHNPGLDDLKDVTLSTPTNGQVLTYNSTTGLWENQTPAAGGVTSVNGQTGVVVLDTDDISEGTTNLYFTDQRAKDAVVNGQDLALDGSNEVYVKTLRDGVVTLGTMLVSYDENAPIPDPASGLLDGTSSIDIVSAAGGPTGKGYGAAMSLNYYSGDTAAGLNSAPSVTYRAATGTSTAPTVSALNQVIGTINTSTYSGTDWAAEVATNNAGGGRTVLQPLQYQFYAATAPAETSFAVTSTAATQSNITIGAVVSSGSGVFTNTSADIRQYDVIRVTGTLTGTMTFPGYVSGNLYYVLSGANPTTTFTISDTQDGDPVATTAGTTTGLTFQRCRSNITLPASTNGSYFGIGGVVTASGYTPAGFNGTFRAVYGTTTSVGYGNYHTGGTATVQGSITGGTVVTGAMAYRVRAFPANYYYNGANRINLIDHSATTATYRADTHIWQGATNTFQYLNMNAAGATLNVGSLSIKDLTGANTYFTSGLLATKTFTPFRYNLTAGGNFAAGSTYTPASTVTNAISATINSGATATFTIAVTNLKASATEGGHYQISVTNTSGADQTVTTSGCNTNPSLLLTNGSSCMVTIYVVGTLAFAEILS